MQGLKTSNVPNIIKINVILLANSIGNKKNLSIQNKFTVQLQIETFCKC